MFSLRLKGNLEVDKYWKHHKIMPIRVPTLEEINAITYSYRFQYLVNPKICEQIYSKLRLETVYANQCRDLKVLDLYPGPSITSVVFNNRFCPKQHFLMDMKNAFVQFQDRYLIPYNNENLMTMVRKDPYDWSSYTDLIEKEHQLEPGFQDRSKLHNQFLIMANVTERKQEGLVMQWVNCLGNKNWLMKFGNVKMLLWIPSQTAVKLLAPPGNRYRNKCSLYLEAFAQTNLIAVSQSETILKEFDKPLVEKCAPILIDNKEDIFPQTSKAQASMSLLEINPKDQNFDVDTWDYVTKQLMILRRTPLVDAVESLGHGAREYYLERIKDTAFLQRCPVTFTFEEFLYVTKIFKDWPFKPDIYLELYDLKLDDMR